MTIKYYSKINYKDLSSKEQRAIIEFTQDGIVVDVSNLSVDEIGKIDAYAQTKNLTYDPLKTSQYTTKG